MELGLLITVLYFFAFYYLLERIGTHLKRIADHLEKQRADSKDHRS